MPPVQSAMLPLGTPAPDFDLPDPRGGRHTLASFAESPVLVVAFICNHCPFVKHVADELARLQRDYGPRGVALVAINPNDVERFPDDAPERMAEVAAAHGWTFPYLFDESQAVAKAYRATCTPDFYVFDAARTLVYRGRLDGTRPGSGEPDGAELRAALDALGRGRRPDATQLPSIGCSIKWKPGTVPAYATA